MLGHSWTGTWAQTHHSRDSRTWGSYSGYFTRVSRPRLTLPIHSNCLGTPSTLWLAFNPCRAFSPTGVPGLEGRREDPGWGPMGTRGAPALI